jgi:hypothetical protein
MIRNIRTTLSCMCQDTALAIYEMFRSYGIHWNSETTRYLLLWESNIFAPPFGLWVVPI